MASLAVPAPLASSPLERRLQAEWDLLLRMVALNPGRLLQPVAEDNTFRVTLTATPALSLQPSAPLVQQHSLRIVYPRFFPALPLELYLDTPVVHPNLHPETGFLCLWDQHRTANTIEHALHKTVAMLGWRLLNLDARHVMQQAAAALSAAQVDEFATRLHAPPLQGVESLPISPPTQFRRRLS